MSGPYSSLIGCPSGLFTGKTIEDTDFGLSLVTPPSAYNINGEIPGYIIREAGNYFFHVQVNLFANCSSPTPISAQASIIFTRGNYTLKKVSGKHSAFLVNAPFYAQFTLHTSTIQPLAVGDVVFVNLYDLAAPDNYSSYMKFNSADPESSFFEGYKI